MTAFEELIKHSTDEDLKVLSHAIQEELDERSLKNFLEEKEKVLTALKNFKKKFPFSSINFGGLCDDCYTTSRFDILEYINDLDFVR